MSRRCLEREKKKKAKERVHDELYLKMYTKEGEAKRLSWKGSPACYCGDRDGNVLMSEDSVLKRWREYFEEIMNEKKNYR